MNKELEKQILNLAGKIEHEENKIKGKKEANSIQDVRYIENAIELDGDYKNLICMVFDKGEGNSSFRYYIDNELVCVWDRDVSKKPIFTTNRVKTMNIDLEKVRLLIQNPERFGAEDISVKEELEKNEKLLEKIAVELGVSANELKGMLFPEGKKKEKNKQIKNEKKSEQEETHKVFVNDVNIKQYLDVNTKVDEMRTLGQLLKLQPDCVSVGVIESDEMDEVNKDAEESTRYAFVAVNQDNTVEQIAILEEDHSVGANSTQQTYKVEHDGNVEKNTILSRYTIDGTNATLSARNGDMGRVEVFYSPDKSRDGNESFDKQLQTSNIQFSTRTEQRNIAGYYDSEGDYDKVGNAIKRAESTNVRDYDDTEYKDLDSDSESQSNGSNDIDYDTEIILEDGNITTIREEAEKDKVSPEEFLNKYRNASGKTQEERIENVHDEIENEYRGGDRKR